MSEPTTNRIESEPRRPAATGKVDIAHVHGRELLTPGPFKCQQSGVPKAAKRLTVALVFYAALN
jgi:hypothetical protein